MSNITTTILDCSMPLVVEEISGVRSAAITLAIPAGNGEDSADALGLAPMLAELVLRGSADRDSRADADAFDRIGVARSAAAGVYYLSLSATMLGDRLEDALILLIDMLRKPRFDDSAIDPAREQCLAALESLKDDPQERAVLAARDRHFVSPFDRTGLGTAEGLQSLTREHILQGWNHRAVPGRAICGIAGHVKAEKVAHTLNQLLKGWSGTRPPFPVGAPKSRGYQHTDDPSNQVQIIILHDAPCDNALTERQALLEKVIVNVLSGGMAGRLFSEVREKRGLCYSVSASYRGDREFGTCSAYVGTTPEKAQQSLDVLVAELQRINTPEGRITPEEFQRAMVGMKTGVVFSGESTAGRAAALVNDVHRLGRPRSLASLAAAIDSVTLDEVNAYLATRSITRPTIQTLGPTALKSPI